MPLNRTGSQENRRYWRSFQSIRSYACLDHCFQSFERPLGAKLGGVRTDEPRGRFFRARSLNNDLSRTGQTCCYFAHEGGDQECLKNALLTEAQPEKSSTPSEMKRESSRISKPTSERTVRISSRKRRAKNKGDVNPRQLLHRERNCPPCERLYEARKRRDRLAYSFNGARLAR